MNGSTYEVSISTLARLQPISALLEEQIAELAAQTQEHALLAGHTLFKEGDSDTNLIYLIEGEVKIQPANGAAYTVKSGSSESLHPLGENNPRRSSAIATTAVLYVRIDSDLVDTMLTWAESASSENEEVIMGGNDIITINTSSLKSKMQHSPNFRKLPAANIDQLLDKMEAIRIEAGEVVIRQGDEGDYFYIIEEGEALVTRVIDDDENAEDSIEMAHLGEGSSFGEAALISNSPRNATVSMQTDGVLLRLNKENFLKLLQDPTQNWVNYREALDQIEAGAVWIDVRTAADFADGHLPNAINIPMNDAHRRSQDLAHDKNYICYCQTGRRSSAAAFILSQYGIESSVLQGGLPGIEGDVEMTVEARAS